MRVCELIEILRKLPADYRVEVDDDESGAGGHRALRADDIVNMDIFGPGHHIIVIG